MTTAETLAAHDRAEDVGTAASTCPVAWWCPACGEPQYVGEPDDACVECGGFDWEMERRRGWTS